MLSNDARLLLYVIFRPAFVSLGYQISRNEEKLMLSHVSKIVKTMIFEEKKHTLLKENTDREVNVSEKDRHLHTHNFNANLIKIS